MTKWVRDEKPYLGLLVSAVGLEFDDHDRVGHFGHGFGGHHDLLHLVASGRGRRVDLVDICFDADAVAGLNRARGPGDGPVGVHASSEVLDRPSSNTNKVDSKTKTCTPRLSVAAVEFAQDLFGRSSALPTWRDLLNLLC